MFKTDGNEYHLLTNVIPLVKGVEGLTCEIGLRLGGGSKMIMHEFIKNNDPRIHVAIDPYGDIVYSCSDIRKQKCGYTNKMRDECLLDLYSWCKDNKQDFLFFQLESTEFFKRFGDGIPTYNGEKIIETKYCLVHIDGQHSLVNTTEEFLFFKDRMDVGAIIVFDDACEYNHNELELLIFSENFKIISSGTYKKIYQKC